MTKFRKQLFSVLTAGSMLLSIASPALADTTVQISGNGSGSNNQADVSQTQSTQVVQENVADITNNVNVNSSTGDNKANSNTGGDVTILSGNSKVNTTVSNEVNQNVASVKCCEPGNVNVTIAGNGASPTPRVEDPKDPNTVKLDLSNKTSVYQTNKANVNNNVDVNSKTGDNKANDNTGGSVTIGTGNAESTVAISTQANANVAEVSGGTNRKIDAKIVGNGSGSNNNIDLDFNNSTLVSQKNDAYVTNRVDVDSKTGGNKANFNTGGDVTVVTGNAKVGVGIDNMLNFNFASADCGCVLNDLTAKIADNGARSRNNIDLDFNSNRENGNGTFQENKVRLHNYLDDLDAKTGNNESNHNTGVADPKDAVWNQSGNSTVNAEVQNSVNLNQSGPDVEFPWNLPGNSHVNLTLDLSELLGWLRLSV